MTLQIPPSDPGTSVLTVTTDVRENANVVVLRLVGEIDASTIERARESLDVQLGGSWRGVVLDFTGVTFLAACGLNLLAEAAEAAEQTEHAGRALRLVLGEAAAVRRALMVSDLDGSLPQAPSVAEAVLLCSTPPGPARR